MVGEGHKASAAIAAHTSRSPVCIEIYHCEIRQFVIFQEQQPIGPDPKLTVAETRHQFGIVFGEGTTAVVDDNKVVPRSLVFMEFQFHLPTKEQI